MRLLKMLCMVGSLSLTSCSYFFGDDDEAELATDTDDFEEEESGPPHPRLANAWETKILDMGNGMPAPRQMTQCRNQIGNLSASARNEDMMIRAEDRLKRVVQTNPELFHWCFYKMMTELDDKMEEPVTLINDRARVFFEDMRRMWVFARALDKALQKEKYFGYLRRRYVEMSKHHFARDLEVIGEPMGNRPRYFRVNNRRRGDRGTPAGQANVN